MMIDSMREATPSTVLSVGDKLLYFHETVINFLNEINYSKYEIAYYCMFLDNLPCNCELV